MSRHIELFFAAALQLLAQAQPDGGRPYRIGGGVSAPVPVYKPEPEYPEEARLARYEGTVVIFVVIDAEGRPRGLKLMRPSPFGTDRAAIATLEKWRFRPGQKLGPVPMQTAVPVQATIEVNFRLPRDNPSSATDYWHTVNATFDLPPSAEPPHLVKASFQNLPDPGRTASFDINFDVDVGGYAEHVMVNSSDSNKEAIASEFEKSWIFEPAKNGSVPVPVHAKFVLRHDSPGPTR